MGGGIWRFVLCKKYIAKVAVLSNFFVKVCKFTRSEDLISGIKICIMYKFISATLTDVLNLSQANGQC